MGEPIDIQRWMPDGEGIYRAFLNGVIFWHPDVNAQAVYGPNFIKWLDLKEKNLDFGYPVTSVESINDAWKVVHFQDGSIFFNSSRKTTAEIHGKIRLEWAKLDTKKNCLGFPIKDQEVDGTRIKNVFEFGVLKLNQNQQLEISCGYPNRERALIKPSNILKMTLPFLIEVPGKRNFPLYFYNHSSNKKTYRLFNQQLFKASLFPNKGQKYQLIDLMGEVEFPNKIQIKELDRKKGEESEYDSYVVAIADSIKFSGGNKNIYGKEDSVINLVLIADTVKISGKSSLGLDGVKAFKKAGSHFTPNQMHGGTLTIIARNVVCENGGLLTVNAQGYGYPGYIGSKEVMAGDGGRVALFIKGRKISDLNQSCIRSNLSGGRLTKIKNKKRADYLGCFKDKGNKKYRDLRGMIIEIKKMTIDHCKSTCLEKKFTYAVAQNWEQCFCGNTLMGYSRLPEIKCKYRCAGNMRERCGGMRRANSIYFVRDPRNGIDGEIIEAFDIPKHEKLRHLLSLWVNKLIEKQKADIDVELATGNTLLATKHYLRIKDTIKNFAKPFELALDNTIVKDFLKNYENKILPIIENEIELRFNDKPLPIVSKYFVKTKTGEAYLPPSSLLIQPHKNTEGKHVLGFINYNPENPNIIDLVFDAKLTVEPAIEILAKEEFKKLGLIYKGIFSGINLAAHPIQWSGLKNSKVTSNGTNLHISLSLDENTSMLVLSRLATTRGLPWKFDWVFRNQPQIKGLLNGPPISLVKVISPDVFINNGKIHNKSNSTVQLDYLFSINKTSEFFKPPLVLKPGEEKQLSQVLKQFNKKVEYQVVPEAVSMDDIDPADSFKILRPDLIEQFRIINHIGNDKKLGLLQFLSFKVVIQTRKGSNNIQIKRGPFTLAPTALKVRS